MATLFVKHRVQDFGNWKREYDSFASARKANGVTGASVHRDADDSNVVIVTHQFKDLASARAFMGLEELKSAMGNAGVIGPPEIWFSQDVEQTAF